ncbi:hypothetical protein, partial [Rhodopseudomonas sp. BAL398]|uniref:hypothetical protein n=1 Tax=Rhodopseudomonas sp. BAL398 TaxID=3034676 RepID=UPI0023E119B6
PAGRAAPRPPLPGVFAPPPPRSPPPRPPPPAGPPPPPDREAIQGASSKTWIASSQLLLAMTT